MAESLTTQCCLIVLFWILVPTFDQYTDINLIQRLFRGPSDDTNITSCKLNIKIKKDHNLIQNLQNFEYIFPVSITITISENIFLDTFFPTLKKHEGVFKYIDDKVRLSYTKVQIC